MPKAERRRLPEISPDEIFREWKLGIAEESLQQIRQKLEQLLAEKDAFKAWKNNEYEQQFINRLEALNQAYTDACLNWYEEWTEFHPEDS